MSETINTFEKHIPNSIVSNNKNLEKLLKVLNGMLHIRKEQVFVYTRSFLYPLVSDMKIMRRYIDEWKAEYTEESSRFCIDCLYRNYFYIYSRKGTYDGLIKLLTCLMLVDEEPFVTIEGYRVGKPLILFDDNKPFDWLPEGQDLANELSAVSGEEVWCPMLLDDTWLHQYATLDITVDINYTPTPEFMEFLRSVIVLYLPMISRNFINININIV